MKKRTDEQMRLLRTTGFAKLKPGRIHNRCYSCGRKTSNLPIIEGDPNGAFLCESECPRCGDQSGSKDAPQYFFDALGDKIPYCEACAGCGCDNCSWSGLALSVSPASATPE